MDENTFAVGLNANKACCSTVVSVTDCALALIGTAKMGNSTIIRLRRRNNATGKFNDRYLPRTFVSILEILEAHGCRDRNETRSCRSTPVMVNSKVVLESKADRSMS